MVLVLMLLCDSIIYCIQNGCGCQDLVGNGMQKNVICGNATAELLGRVLYPLVEWLYVHRVTEQPVPCLKQLATVSKSTIE